MTKNTKLIKIVHDAVHKVSKSSKNHAGYSAWTHHIIPAVKFGRILSKKLKADEEIVELALLLHDYGSIYYGVDKLDVHHLTGSKLAEEILTKHNYPKDRTERIKHCIVSHRASQKIPRKTIEAKIVASSDALSHFANIDDLFFLTLVMKKMETDDARRFILKKLANSYKKLMPEAKKLIDKKYNAIKIALKPGA